MAECPTCNREFDSSHGMKVHHASAHGEKLGGFTHECEVCGDEFESKESERAYCSRDCFGKGHGEKLSGENHPMWNGGKVECTCEYCGGTYKEYPSKADRPHCSASCAGKQRMEKMDVEENPFYTGAEKVTLDCEVCGDGIEVYESNSDRRFCSKECTDVWQVESGHVAGENNPLWAGGHVKYGSGWNERKKEEVRDRDGRECVNCGLSEARHIEIFGTRHHVHHIQKARDFDDPKKRNAPKNLVTLCKGKCHALWESMSPLRPDV